MKNCKLAKLTLLVLIGTQLLSVEAYADSKFKETLLTDEAHIIDDPEFKIGKPVIEEISDEEVLELMNKNPENVVSSNPITIPERPIEPIEENDLPDLNTEASTNPNARRIGGMSNGNPLDPMMKARAVIMIIGDLVALGKEIAPIVQKGIAVVENSPMDAISVVPIALSKEVVTGVMSNWSDPLAKNYTFTFPNGVGREVVKIIYSVSFQYRGKYQGKGSYITGLRAAAKYIDVKYGYDVSMKSQLISISNVGSAENVVAGASIEMMYTVKNFSRTITSADTFFIKGNGQLIRQP